MKLTDVEKSVLRQLHLQGFVNWGSMLKSKRVPMLKDLQKRGYLDDNLNLTAKAISETV